MTIEDIKSMVDKRFSTDVKFEDGEPKYVFTHLQTGGTTSCAYNREEYHGTLKELLGYK